LVAYLSAIQYSVSGSQITNWSNTTFDTNTLPDGWYNLTARANDSIGKKSTSTNVSILVDNLYPNASIFYPAQGQQINGSFWINASANDSANVSSVAYEYTTTQQQRSQQRLDFDAHFGRTTNIATGAQPPNTIAQQRIRLLQHNRASYRLSGPHQLLKQRDSLLRQHAGSNVSIFYPPTTALSTIHSQSMSQPTPRGNQQRQHHYLHSSACAEA